MHFETLRRIAETASGRRYEDLWFVVTEDEVTGHAKISVLTSAPPEGGSPEGAVVIPCAGWARPDVPRVSAAMIASGDIAINLLSVDVPPQGGPQGDPAVKGLAADAVFLSASAVEKFLVPYYASVYGDTAPDVVERLVSIFVPPGSPERGDSGGERVEPAVDGSFAVIHLPSSEYAADAAGRVDAPHSLPELFMLTTGGKMLRP
ncbi:MAG: hypothetical protein ACJ8J0_15095 [Longimicrobiaceae bacterium]